MRARIKPRHLRPLEFRWSSWLFACIPGALIAGGAHGVATGDPLTATISWALATGSIYITATDVIRDYRLQQRIDRVNDQIDEQETRR